MDSEQVEQELRKLLCDVSRVAGKKFSGIGIVVYETAENLPNVSLRSSTPRLLNDTLQDLVNLSTLDNPYHDGFHFLNSSLKLTHVAQYFSPPIPLSYELPTNELFGGRYVAALFGSCLPGVIATGIATQAHRVAVFESGREVS